MIVRRVIGDIDTSVRLLTDRSLSELLGGVSIGLWWLGLVGFVLSHTISASYQTVVGMCELTWPVAIIAGALCGGVAFLVREGSGSKMKSRAISSSRNW